MRRAKGNCYALSVKQDVTAMPGRPATVRDIAARSGVSIATVSRVLNDHPGVSPYTRQLVQSAADELDAQARGSRAGAVYLRCPYPLSDYFGLIVSSVAETLDLHGRTLILNAGEAAQHTAVLPTLHTFP